MHTVRIGQLVATTPPDGRPPTFAKQQSMGPAGARPLSMCLSPPPKARMVGCLDASPLDASIRDGLGREGRSAHVLFSLVLLGGCHHTTPLWRSGTFGFAFSACGLSASDLGNASALELVEREEQHFHFTLINFLRKLRMEWPKKQDTDPMTK